MSDIDRTQVDNLFAALSAENRNKIMVKALKKGAQKLADETKLQLRAKLGAGATSGKRYNTPLEKGIKVKSENAYSEVDVHIMGDFRLKFFEKGTRERETRGHRINGYSGRHLRRTGRGGKRGKITALNFFRAARQNEAQINEVISASITEQLRRI